MSHLEPRIPAEINAKLKAVSESEKPYNMLFVGSSLVEKQLDPELFDSTLKEQQVEIHSYNMGIAGMYCLEQDAYITRICDLKLPSLKWIILNTSAYTPTIPPDKQYTDRLVWCHDLHGTLSMLRLIFLQNANISFKVHWAYIHLLHFGKFIYRTGEAGAIFKHYTKLEEEFTPPWNDRGFEKLDTVELALSHRRLEFLYGPYDDRYSYLTELVNNFSSDYEKKKKRNADAMQNAFELGPMETDLQIKALGVNLFYYLPPIPDNLFDWKQFRDSGFIENILDFNHPEIYPELYDLDVRFDRVHLNSQGSALQTKLIAEQFYKTLSVGGAQQ